MPNSAQRALAELYEQHAASALRLAYLMTGDPRAAEDLVQEAFARMFARFQDRRPPQAVEAYLRRSIINLSNDRFRRLKTVRAFLARGVSSPTSQAPPDVESRLVMRSRLQQLPHRQCAALVLRYYEDLSEDQAAEVLHCSVPALKQLVQRGVRTMREQQRGDIDG
ncbi:MAG TPA: sigma-70 family RNA polymerase sigma factor [Actinomycetota bacterium]|nr:sigma-70 family RNA polymerase sigma factor [Actinomycetota bacterium]